MVTISIQLGRWSFEWSLWKTWLTYEAKESEGYVQIKEQRRKFIPKYRRLVHYKIGHDRRK